MKYTLRILCIAITSLLLILSIAGCSLSDRIYTMPETQVTLNDMQVTIPYGYIIDSTQSNDTSLVYETGFYAKYIVVTQTVTVAAGKEDQTLDNYVTRILESGGSSQRTTFLDQPAVRSTFTSQDGKNAEEMLFIYKGYCYAISMSGGNEQEFQDLLSTVVLIHKTTQM